MARLRLDEIARITGGTVLRGSPTLSFGSYGIDSRLSAPGGLFFAVPGRRDGHDFVADAQKKGAAGAIVARPVTVGDPSFALVQVRDVVAALQALAHDVLVRRPARVVGITGSVGKTTTRAFTAELLARRFRVQSTAGSFNNEIGVPLTLLQLRPDTQRAVIEMGMYTTGEIATLCTWARPAVGVVLNVGPVHMERAGSMEAIARAKRELVEALPADGAAILNIDDARVAAMAPHTSARVVTIGRAPRADVRASDVTGHGREGFTFTLTYEGASLNVRVRLPGSHLVTNLLAATATCLVDGFALAEVVTGIEALRDSPRMRVVALANGVTLLDDTYNANPASMAAALDLLAELPGRHVALLGDMRELGAAATEEHRVLGEHAAATLDVLLTIGDLAAGAGAHAHAAGLESVRHIESVEVAASALCRALEPGDVVLVKGSRALALDAVVAALERGIGLAP